MDPADTEAVRRAISHQQAQLGQHDQALQEITSSLRELSLTITSRLPVTPVPPVPDPNHSASPREPFIPAHERYEGDLGQCRPFLLQCSLVFELQPQTYPTDGALRGEALAWAMAVWERGSPACFDDSIFTEEMQRISNHPVRGREASERLLFLCQGSRSVASFTVEFRTLAVESGWNEEALQGVFLNALGSDVKDELTSREESSDLEHLIALAIRVDNRLRERRRERALLQCLLPCGQQHLGLLFRFLFHRVTSGDLFRSPSPCRSDARTSPPRRGGRRGGPPDSLPSLPLLWSDGPLPVWMSLSPRKRAGSPVTRGILASRSLDPSVSCPLLCATLLWQDQTSPLTILLDSGADESFIDREVVHQLGIDTVPLEGHSLGWSVVPCLSTCSFRVITTSPYHFL